MRIGTTTVALVRGDISAVKADAIVNAANKSLAGGGGVDRAIHRAGGPAILEECRRIGGCETGSAVATGAGKLAARWVIHAVAPRYRGKPQDAAALASAYRTGLELADTLGARSLAFPSLGTGAYGYPVAEAAAIAAETVALHLRGPTNIHRVTFVLFAPDDLRAYESAFRCIAMG
jgi:O-acetyl-ADP-ribose deacetylase (regulator of RNase III)